MPDWSQMIDILKKDSRNIPEISFFWVLNFFFFWWIECRFYKPLVYIVLSIHQGGLLLHGCVADALFGYNVKSNLWYRSLSPHVCSSSRICSYVVYLLFIYVLNAFLSSLLRWFSFFIFFSLFLREFLVCQYGWFYFTFTGRIFTTFDSFFYGFCSHVLNLNFKDPVEKHVSLDLTGFYNFSHSNVKVCLFSWINFIH